MQAELVSIGTELLLGAITDTNATHIAQALQEIGLDLIYKTTVGDNQQRIARVIDHALDRVDVVITSGGLGPTVDDVTREAVAEATGRTLEVRQELLDQIADRFRRFGVRMSENNQRQAMVPQGALAIENPVGTAPIFILETPRGVVMVLPGVPREMKYLLEHELVPWLRTHIGDPAVIRSLTLRTVGIGESQVDARIGDLMTGSNPTVGLAAHAGQTDIRITAKAATESDAETLIAPVAAELRRRLGSWIYAEGDALIEDTVVRLLGEHQFSLAVVEAGTGGTLKLRLTEATKRESAHPVRNFTEAAVQDISGANHPDLEAVARIVAETARLEHGTTYGLCALIRSTPAVVGGLEPGTAVAVSGPEGTRVRSFGWSTERTDVSIWASTHGLALLRRMILNAEEQPT